MFAMFMVVVFISFVIVAIGCLLDRLLWVVTFVCL